MVMFSAERKGNIHSSEGLWMLPDTDIDLSVVPKSEFDQEDPLGLGVIPQPSYPSPNYESEFGDAVTALETYLSPRGEESMDIAGSVSENSDILDMGSVAFDDLLDGDYLVPAVQENFDADLQQFLQENDSASNDSTATSHDDAEDVTVDVTTPPTPVFSDAKNNKLDNKSGQEKMESDNKIVNILKDRENTSRVVILKQKDGTSKVLNVVPVKSGELLKPSRRPVANCVTVAKRDSSPPRRSARTITCHRPAPPSTARKSPSLVSMYPKCDQPKEETVEDKSRRNAIQAKLNREKKKAYMSTLEQQVSGLTKENHQLKSQTSKLVREKDSLAEEVEYLRSVIANESSLSRLLGNITDVKSVSLSTSFRNDRKRMSSDEDHDYVRPAKSSKSAHRKPATQISGGVCLHVENDNVSLEFCSSCARMAKGVSRSEISGV